MDTVKKEGNAVRFSVEWQPYILNRSIPASGVSLRTYLERVYGSSRDFDSGRKRIQMVGLQCTPPIMFKDDQNRVLYPTLDVHRCVEWLKSKEPGAEEKHLKLMDSLFHEYFEKGRPANDVEMVVGSCELAGYTVSADEIRTFWRSGMLASETLSKEAALKDMYPTASGAPHFVIEGVGLVGEPARQLSGAQPVSLFLKVFRDLLGIHERKQGSSLDAPKSACAVCGLPATKRCGGCHVRKFCSQACQRKDWPSHKDLCTPSSCGPDGCAL